MLKPFRGCRSEYKVKSTQQARILNIQVITQTRRICIPNPVSYINKLNDQTLQRRYLVPLNRSQAPLAPRLPTITLLNSRSLLQKIDELSILLPQYRSDIAVIAETWSRPDVSTKLLTIDGYNLHRADRHVGGACIFSSNGVPCKRRFDLESSDFECLYDYGCAPIVCLDHLLTWPFALSYFRSSRVIGHNVVHWAPKGSHLNSATAPPPYQTLHPRSFPRSGLEAFGHWICGVDWFADVDQVPIPNAHYREGRVNFN